MYGLYYIDLYLYACECVRVLCVYMYSIYYLDIYICMFYYYKRIIFFMLMNVFFIEYEEFC